VPICLIGLGHGGLQLVLALVAMITIVHMFEAYILNPRIMGAALHMNPVMVLAILTVGGKLLGPWGLILGVPLCYFVFAYAIWSKDDPSESRATSRQP
jgi:predicted PurR-regulated permease PerM